MRLCLRPWIQKRDKSLRTSKANPVRMTQKLARLINPFAPIRAPINSHQSSSLISQLNLSPANDTVLDAGVFEAVLDNAAVRSTQARTSAGTKASNKVRIDQASGSTDTRVET